MKKNGLVIRTMLAAALSSLMLAGCATSVDVKDWKGMPTEAPIENTSAGTADEEKKFTEQEPDNTAETVGTETESENSADAVGTEAESGNTAETAGTESESENTAEVTEQKPENTADATGTESGETENNTDILTDDNETPSVFEYIHDPRKNPGAMADIIENPDAVYGFSPDPESKRLGVYAEFDWSDPETVESAKVERIAYHESIEGMYEMLFALRAEGKSIEEMARTISAERNRIRLESYKDDPENLEAVKKSNLEAYGNEEGPTADSLFEKYGSWEMVLQKAFGTNSGMDACVGLYDDYYTLYIELGLVESEE